MLQDVLPQGFPFKETADTADDWKNEILSAQDQFDKCFKAFKLDKDGKNRSKWRKAQDAMHNLSYFRQNFQELLQVGAVRDKKKDSVVLVLNRTKEPDDLNRPYVRAGFARVFASDDGEVPTYPVDDLTVKGFAVKTGLRLRLVERIWWPFCLRVLGKKKDKGVPQLVFLLGEQHLKWPIVAPGGVTAGDYLASVFDGNPDTFFDFWLEFAPGEKARDFTDSVPISELVERFQFQDHRPNMRMHACDARHLMKSNGLWLAVANAEKSNAGFRQLESELKKYNAGHEQGECDRFRALMRSTLDKIDDKKFPGRRASLDKKFQTDLKEFETAEFKQVLVELVAYAQELKEKGRHAATKPELVGNWQGFVVHSRAELMDLRVVTGMMGDSDSKAGYQQNAFFYGGAAHLDRQEELLLETGDYDVLYKGDSEPRAGWVKIMDYHKLQAAFVK